MTVKELFENKYREKVANITAREWERVKQDAECKKMHPAKYMFLCLEITEKDLRANGMFYFGSELEELHKAKCISSNRHRQERGHIDRYWLTEKGYKKIIETA